MGLFRGLSGRLLIVTVAAVMAVEVCIFVPSVARFRADFLEERVTRGHLAAMAAMAAPDRMVTETLERDLLAGAGIHNVVLRMGSARALMLSRDAVPPVRQTFDLRGATGVELVADALARLATAPAPGGETIRVIGTPESAPGTAVEITLDAGPLRAAMIDYGIRILQLSLIISAIAAAAVFLLIRRVVVGPLMRLVDNVTAFKEAPEDPARIMRPSGRGGEMADAEAAIAEMQEDVRRALAERARLAELGEAVAKIAHDLRNMLSAQQMLLDRLERSSDPMVARVMPKMIASLDRAIRFCQRTLKHGRAEEAAPEPRPLALAGVVAEVGETLGLGEAAGAVLENAVDAELVVVADPEHLHRALSNLIRNAAEAIGAAGGEGRIRVSAELRDGEVAIRVADTGPGLPEQARRHLFEPFRGSGRRGGTGLGLAIAQDLTRAHGGELRLLRSGAEGSVFEIALPQEVGDRAA